MNDSTKEDLQRMQDVLDLRKIVMLMALEYDDAELYNAVTTPDHFEIHAILSRMAEEAAAAVDALDKTLDEERPFEEHVKVLIHFGCRTEHSKALACLRDEALVVTEMHHDIGEAGRSLVAMPTGELMQRVKTLEAGLATATEG